MNVENDQNALSAAAEPVNETPIQATADPTAEATTEATPEATAAAESAPASVPDDLPKPKPLTPSQLKAMERLQKYGLDKRQVRSFYTTTAWDSSKKGPAVSDRPHPGKAARKAAKRAKVRARIEAASPRRALARSA